MRAGQSVWQSASSPAGKTGLSDVVGGGDKGMYPGTALLCFGGYLGSPFSFC